MFDDNFSFAAVRSLSRDSSNAPSSREPSRSVSPFSSLVAPFPQPRTSVSDLAAQLADSRLQTESRICFDSCEAYANTDDDAGWQIECATQSSSPSDYAACSRPSQTLFSRPQSPSQRSRRQSNARLLCSASHRHDIAALMARMVQSQEQCSLVASARPMTPTTEDDEGYDSYEAAHSRRSSLAVQKARLGDYRRSSDMKSTGACVSKSARFRKDRNPARHRNAVE